MLANIRRVHTADDERASWVTLLSTLQLLEYESRLWEERNSTTPRGCAHEKPEYTLAIGLQSKTRSWDFMVSLSCSLKLKSSGLERDIPGRKQSADSGKTS